MRSGNGECGIVVTAVGTDILLLEFRDRIFAVRRLGLHRRYIRIFPVHGAPGASPAHLQAGASVKNDQDILAQVLGLIFLSLAESFAGRHHQNDGNDPPGDAKHGQKCAQLVSPERSQHIANEITQDHLVWTRWLPERKPEAPEFHIRGPGRFCSRNSDVGRTLLSAAVAVGF